MNRCRVDLGSCWLAMMSSRLWMPVDIAVVVLRAKTNRLEDLAPLIPRMLELLPTLRPGQSVEIS